MKETNLLLAKLDPDELKVLERDMERMTLSYSYKMIVPHEPITDCYFPINCLASLVTVLGDGSAVEAGSVGREGMVGTPVILNAETTPMETLVQVPGDAFRVKAETVKALFEQRGRFYTIVNQFVHTLFVVASQSTACNRRHNVVKRLARWLLMSSDGVGSNEVAITHEFLAVMLGVRRAGVTEAAGKLQDARLIEPYKRGGVRIIDRKGLEKAACECYRAVRNEYDRLLA